MLNHSQSRRPLAPHPLAPRPFAPRAFLASTFLVGALLAGCSAAGAEGPGQAELGEVATPEVAAAQVELSPADHLIKALGESGELVSPAGQVLLEISIDAITPAQSCPSRAHDLQEVPGNYLILEVSARLAADIGDHAQADTDPLFFPLGADTFSLYTPSGDEVSDTASTDAWECFDDAALLPPFITPGQSVQGYVVLEADATTGSVAYSPAGASGWVWEF